MVEVWWDQMVSISVFHGLLLLATSLAKNEMTRPRGPVAILDGEAVYARHTART